MLNLHEQVYLEQEIITFLNRRLHSGFELTSSKLYEPLKLKLQSSYDRLEKTYQVIQNKYSPLLDLLTLSKKDDSDWIGNLLMRIIYFSDNTKSAFAKETMEWLNAISLSYQDFDSFEENHFFQSLENVDISKDEKWNLSLLYSNYDYYSNLFQEMIQELALPISKELENFKDELQLFHTDWKTIVQQDDSLEFIYQKFHIKLEIADSTTQDIYPSVFGYNSITWTDNKLFLGLIFDSNFSFNEPLSIENLCKYLKFLGDSSKFQIINLLLEKPMYGKELSESLELTPATISYHMSDLAKEGLVRFVPAENKRIYYHLNTELLKEIQDALNIHLFSNIN